MFRTKCCEERRGEERMQVGQGELNCSAGCPAGPWRSGHVWPSSCQLGLCAALQMRMEVGGSAHCGCSWAAGPPCGASTGASSEAYRRRMAVADLRVRRDPVSLGPGEPLSGPCLQPPAPHMCCAQGALFSAPPHLWLCVAEAASQLEN